MIGWIVEVIFKGPIDPKTGMVANISDVKKCLQLAVMSQLDHRNLVMISACG